MIRMSQWMQPCNIQVHRNWTFSFLPNNTDSSRHFIVFFNEKFNNFFRWYSSSLILELIFLENHNDDEIFSFRFINLIRLHNMNFLRRRTRETTHLILILTMMILSGHKKTEILFIFHWKFMIFAFLSKYSLICEKAQEINR